MICRSRGHDLVTGYIRCTVHHIKEVPVIGMIRLFEYSWHGGRFARMSMDVLYHEHSERNPGKPMERPKPGDVLKIGPYRVYVLDTDFEIDGYTVLRLDNRLSWLYAGLYKLDQFGYMCSRRTLATLAIWGLADYASYRYMDWTDVYAIRKCKRVYQNVKAKILKAFKKG